jgi:hypothetical protein
MELGGVNDDCVCKDETEERLAAHRRVRSTFGGPVAAARCWECLDRRYPMIDVASAWGRLYELLSSYFGKQLSRRFKDKDIRLSVLYQLSPDWLTTGASGMGTPTEFLRWNNAVKPSHMQETILLDCFQDKPLREDAKPSSDWGREVLPPTTYSLNKIQSAATVPKPFSPNYSEYSTKKSNEGSFTCGIIFHDWKKVHRVVEATTWGLRVQPKMYGPNEDNIFMRGNRDYIPKSGAPVAGLDRLDDIVFKYWLLKLLCLLPFNNFVVPRHSYDKYRCVAGMENSRTITNNFQEVRSFQKMSWFETTRQNDEAYSMLLQKAPRKYDRCEPKDWMVGWDEISELRFPPAKNEWFLMKKDYFDNKQVAAERGIEGVGSSPLECTWDAMTWPFMYESDVEELADIFVGWIEDNVSHAWGEKEKGRNIADFEYEVQKRFFNFYVGGVRVPHSPMWIENVGYPELFLSQMHPEGSRWPYGSDIRHRMWWGCVGQTQVDSYIPSCPVAYLPLSSSYNINATWEQCVNIEHTKLAAPSREYKAYKKYVNNDETYQFYALGVEPRFAGYTDRLLRRKKVFHPVPVLDLTKEEDLPHTPSPNILKRRREPPPPLGGSRSGSRGPNPRAIATALSSPHPTDCTR